MANYGLVCHFLFLAKQELDSVLRELLANLVFFYPRVHSYEGLSCKSC